MAKAFHSLAAATQDRRVREALAAGEKPEAGAVTIYLALPEEEVPAVAEVLERISREETAERFAAEDSKRAETAPKRRAPVEREHEAVTNGGVERTDQAEIATADAPKTKAPVRTRKPAVTTKRVRPVEPKREAFGDGAAGTNAYREAHRKYEAVLEAYRSENTAEVRESEKKAPARRRPAAKASDSNQGKAASATKNGHASRTRIDTGDFDWKAKALPARVLKLKGEGKTIKQVTEVLGLPAREGVWHRVSLIYRAAADAKGLNRPRRSKEAAAK